MAPYSVRSELVIIFRDLGRYLRHTAQFLWTDVPQYLWKLAKDPITTTKPAFRALLFVFHDVLPCLSRGAVSWVRSITPARLNLWRKYTIYVLLGSIRIFGHIVRWSIRETYSILGDYLPCIPRYLWARAKEPMKTFKGIIWIIGYLPQCVFFPLKFLIGEALPRLLGFLVGILRKCYWRMYASGRDTQRGLLQQRRRALTRTGLRTPAQNTSLFLTKLPSEVRMLIYESYFDHQKLLVVPVKRGLGTRAIALSIHDKAGEHYNPRARYEGGIQHGLLDLSLTCKQIYAETIDLMYSSKTFCFTEHMGSFSHVAHVMALQRQILPQRWRAITSIEYNPGWGHTIARSLSLHVPSIRHPLIGQYKYSSDHMFPQLCATFNDMQGLQTVVLTHPPLGWNMEHLNGLLAITRRMKTFDVYLCPHQGMANDFQAALENAQFRLILPNGQSFTHDPVIGSIGTNGGKVRKLARDYGDQGLWQTYGRF